MLIRFLSKISLIIIFFILVAVAALTSTISVLEVIVAFFVEELNSIKRYRLRNLFVLKLGCLLNLFENIFLGKCL